MCTHHVKSEEHRDNGGKTYQTTFSEMSEEQQATKKKKNRKRSTEAQWEKRQTCASSMGIPAGGRVIGTDHHISVSKAQYK